MARARMIKPGIFGHKNTARFCDSCQKLLVALIISADDFGYGDADLFQLQITHWALRRDVAAPDLERWRDELWQAGHIQLSQDSVNGSIYYRLVNWEEHQILRKDYKRDDTYKLKFESASLMKQIRDGPVTDPLRHRDGPEPQVKSSQVKSSKIKNSPAKKPARAKKPQKRARNPEFDAVWVCLLEHSGKEPTPATVQKILNEAKGRVDPTSAIELAYGSKEDGIPEFADPVAGIFDMLANPAKYDRLRNWGCFEEQCYPVKKEESGDPELLGPILQRVTGGKTNGDKR